MIYLRSFKSVLCYALLIVLGLLFALVANADTNLTAICKGGTTSGSSNCTGGVIYDYPGPDKWVRVRNGVFYFWGVIGSTSAVSVCTADIPRGSPNCSAVALIPKAQVPLQATFDPPPSASTMKLEVSWLPPTQGILDGKTVALQPGDIVSYQIAWVPQGGGRGGEFSVPAASSRSVIEIPTQAVYISVSAQGRDSWGASSVPKLFDPAIKPAIVPFAPDALTIKRVPL